MINIQSACLLTLGLISVSQHVFSQNTVSFGPGTQTLGTNQDFRETDLYQIGRFGWFSASIDEAHGEWYYPTPNDYNPPGNLVLDPHNVVVADFNNDGLEDFAVTWNIIPHVIERRARATFTIHINDGNGGFTYNAQQFGAQGPPIRHMAYRTAAEDFNMDGIPDLIASSMGLIQRNPDGTYSNVWEPIPLALSNGDGTFRDASHQIEGQESGGLPEGFSFGHELSAGDVNGDDFPDFFTGKLLFLNDGTGNFSNATQYLPEELNGDAIPYLMTSLIGDLNDDGVEDIVAAYSDEAPGGESGYIWLSSNGDGSFANRQLIPLPDGLFGKGNTKFNHGTLADVNHDGLMDIVFSITRLSPYYEGASLQIIINKGSGIFSDETSQRLVLPNYLDSKQGEGTLFARDMNGDGFTDFVHTLNIYGSDPDHLYPGMTIYMNDASGKLTVLDEAQHARVAPWQLQGFEEYRQYFEQKIDTGFPINIDGQGGVDLVAMVQTPLLTWPQTEPNEYTYYSILSKALYEPNCRMVVPKPSVTDFYFCQGETGFDRISATAASGHQLQWWGTQMSGGVSTSVAPAISTSQVGETLYYVSQLSVEGCESERAGIRVIVKPVPAKPTVSTQSSSSTTTLLSSSATAGNQWYLNGQAINGAQEQQLNVDLPGVYAVSVTVDGCTSSMSDDLTLLTTNLTETDFNKGVHVYPNPASTSLQIIHEGKDNISPSTVVVYDLMGKEIFSKVVYGNHNTISIEALPMGNYQLKIINRSFTVHKRFVKL